MSIQRTSIVAPFSVNSPLLDGGNTNDMRQENVKGSKKPSSPGPAGVVAVTHQKWFQSVANGINATVQISSEIPATSTSPGVAGTLVPFAGGFYFAVGSNNWLKFIGAPF
jgi:hypothetical protein